MKLYAYFVFLVITLFNVINAEHLDAYFWKDDGTNNERMKTTGLASYKMSNFRKGNYIYWYWGSEYQPACRYGYGKVDKRSVQFLKGDSFNKKICIKPNATFYYLQMDFSSNKLGGWNPIGINFERKAAEALLYDCYWRSYKSPSNRRIVNTTASCNSYGCLTRFGWIENKDIC